MRFGYAIVVGLLASSPMAAYAAGNADPYVLGLHPIIAALGITTAGIMLRTLIGYAGKPKSEFNPGLLATSFVLGFFASIQLVIVSLQHIPADAGDLAILSIIMGEIATVMGIDAGIKSAGKRAQDKYAKIRGNNNGNIGPTT